MSLKKQLEDVHITLNKSYDKLQYHKETLNQQAERVKDQIINNIAMQIDAFNQRKNWLVNQLELVKCDKMDCIQRQQDAVKCSILNVKKIITDHSKYTHIQIKEELENIHNLLSEDTRPFLAFKSDSAVLSEIISQYGVILKQYSGHFADPTRPSISLPRVVEEEDDDENLSFSRKYDSQNKHDQNNLYIAKHPTNSSIVKAWLMTANDLGQNNMEIESVTLKSEPESFVRVDSPESLAIKKMNDVCTIDNDCNELGFPKSSNETEKCTKNIWLLDQNFMDEEKDIDHCELVKKVCKAGNCKSFSDCTEIENCCNRLLDRQRPSWNKWLIDNRVIHSSHLVVDNSPSSNIGPIPTDIDVNQFYQKFSQTLAADNESWLDRRPFKRHVDCETESKSSQSSNQAVWLANKLSRLDHTAGNGSHSELFSPLEKWISWSRKQDWAKNKEHLVSLVDKSLKKITLDEMEVASKNDKLSIDNDKWLVGR